MAYVVDLLYQVVFDEKSDAEMFYADIVSAGGNLELEAYQSRAVIFNSAREPFEIAADDSVPPATKEEENAPTDSDV